MHEMNGEKNPLSFLSKTINSEKRYETVATYAKSVRNLWIRSFTETFVVSIDTVRRKITNIMKDYETRVGICRQSSFRGRNQLWMEMDVPQPKRGPRVRAKNSSLFTVAGKQRTLLARRKLFTLINVGSGVIC